MVCVGGRAGRGTSQKAMANRRIREWANLLILKRVNNYSTALWVTGRAMRATRASKLRGAEKRRGGVRCTRGKLSPDRVSSDARSSMMPPSSMAHLLTIMPVIKLGFPSFVLFRSTRQATCEAVAATKYQSALCGGKRRREMVSKRIE